MRGELILAILTIQSSYADEVERPLEGSEGVPDTLQWWFGANGCWRIRTCALDQDIHAYQIGNSPQTTFQMANENNLNNYGDVIKVQHTIHFVDCTNHLELEAEFGRVGLAPRMEIDGNGFASWEPDDAVYSTKSTPSHTETQ